jgi:hypothetical protein
MPSRLLLAALLAALALVLPASALGADRLWIGFQDDPSFRWRDDRHDVLDLAQAANANIVRTTVYWSRVAPQRPASPANPFDKGYRFADLDEMVRESTLRGMEVMLTIWGTPAWANGGKGQNYAPTKPSDLTAFAKALARRYSGRYAGYPLVRFYTVWNESNLGQFLSPQYDSAGQPVGPAIYATIYRAAYGGIKAGNPRAIVGIGETSARGRDRYLGRKGVQETESPGKFAELLSQQRPALRFDAWSHHPYPTEPSLPPTQNVRWPNVTLSQLSRFGAALDQWFHRSNIPIWITEYGYETKPAEPHGVTVAQQAAYARTAISIAREDPRVTMFIWFILRDDPTSAWQSGLLYRDGEEKPAYGVFSALAAAVDVRNPLVRLKAGTRSPVVTVPVTELLARNSAGSHLGVTISVLQGQQAAGNETPEVLLRADATIAVPIPVVVAKGKTVRASLEIGDVNGNVVERTVTIVGT